MHVSEPSSDLEPADYAGARFTDFGLDPPAYLVSLEKADRSVVVADFGTLNAASTSQYVRLVGQPTLYLMPRHVGAEWELTADMAKRPSRRQPKAAMKRRRAPSACRGLLLPASIDRIWAVEIAFKGKLHRLERDGAGNWLLHVGQHRIPAIRPPISPTLARPASLQWRSPPSIRRRSKGSSRIIRTRVTRHYGLGRPMLIALVYQRDNSSPLARIEIGNMAEDGFGRYARIAESGDVVTIAAYEAESPDRPAQDDWGRLVKLARFLARHRAAPRGSQKNAGGRNSAARATRRDA